MVQKFQAKSEDTAHLSTHGRGIYLMRALMDEVHFDEGGAVVRMRKKPTLVLPERGEQMPGKIINSILAVALLGVCALAQDEGQTKTVDLARSKSEPSERLQAIPWANNCIECQEQSEQRRLH
jgi:hypothetical protein